MAEIGRIPPHSIEAEEALISCCLLDGEISLARCAAAGASPIWFYSPGNALVFESLQRMLAEQKAIDVSVLAQELSNSRRLEQVGGFAQLAKLAGAAPTTAQADYFIAVVREKFQLRELILRGSRLVEACFSVTTTGAIESEIVPMIDRIAEVAVEQEAPRTWSSAVTEAETLTRERMKPAAQRNLAGAELPWGLGDFDRFFLPLEPGEVVVIGGYTSAGKSSLLRAIAWHNAKAGNATLVSTLEVRDSEEAINLAAHISGLRSRAHLDRLHETDQKQLLASFEKMKIPTFSVCHQDFSLPAVLARAKAFKRARGLKMLGIDYLQILSDVKNLRPNERPDFAISRVTSELKRFATQENIVVILLSGFNREYIRAGDREPRMSDLDGSSSIEKDASRVILLHVPTEYVLDGQRESQKLDLDASEQPRFFVKAIQAKGRNQGTSSVGLWFRRETKTFQGISTKNPADTEQLAPDFWEGKP